MHFVHILANVYPMKPVSSSPAGGGHRRQIG